MVPVRRDEASAVTHRRLVLCLTTVTAAYMAGFVALYLDKVWEALA
jgi:hypothetical protein